MFTISSGLGFVLSFEKSHALRYKSQATGLSWQTLSREEDRADFKSFFWRYPLAIFRTVFIILSSPRDLTNFCSRYEQLYFFAFWETSAEAMKLQAAQQATVACLAVGSRGKPPGSYVPNSEESFPAHNLAVP